MEALFFYLFGTVAVICALAMVTRRDAVTSVFWLIACFLNIAAIFALLSAHLMAVLQVLVYTGAILVIFLFVTMFLGEADRFVTRRGRLVPLVASLTVICFGLVLSRLVGADHQQMGALPEGYGTVRAVSQKLLVDYLFLFEVVGLLLLVAVIGAVYIARRGKPNDVLTAGGGERHV